MEAFEELKKEGKLQPGGYLLMPGILDEVDWAIQVGEVIVQQAVQVAAFTEIPAAAHERWTDEDEEIPDIPIIPKSLKANVIPIDKNTQPEIQAKEERHSVTSAKKKLNRIYYNQFDKKWRSVNR